MLKSIFYRSCALVSEVEDTLRHLYRWHRTWSTPPRDRLPDMYALEDRVLFSVAPIVKAAALQAGAGGSQTASASLLTPQTTPMPIADQSSLAVHRGHAGQDAQKMLKTSSIQYNSTIASSWNNLRARHNSHHSHHAHPAGTDRHADFAIIDDSLQNLDQLIRSLNPNTEVCLFDHQKESPTEVLSRVYNWAKTKHVKLDSVSILSHGVSGSFVLGNQWLSSSNMGEFTEAWKRLGAVMSRGGSIDIFGCNVAQGPDGQKLINDIGRLSGAAVYASVDDTGRGGNWALEAASTTAVASAWHNPLNTHILQQWKYELAPGITVTPTSGLITTESGGMVQFTVVLDSAPTADVVIGIGSSDITEGTVNKSSLTFTSVNWATPQSVTITGVDDLLNDGSVVYSIVTAPAGSGDPIYNNMNADDVSVTNIDNEPGVTVIPVTGLTTTETGDTTQFTAVLNTQPASDVTVTFSSNDLSEGTVYTDNVGDAIAHLEWDVWNWTQGYNGWQYGHFANGDTTSFQQLFQNANGVNIQGWNYMPGNNNDWAVIRYVAQDTGKYNFSGSFGKQSWSNWGDGVTVRLLLNGQLIGTPQVIAGGDVSSYPILADVAMKAGDTFDFCIDPGTNNSGDNINIPVLDVAKHTGSVTFHTSDWNTPQTIYVMGVDDLVADGNVAYKVTGITGSSDPIYDTLHTTDIDLTNIDNDLAGVQIIESGGSTNVTEGGTTDTYTVRLTSQPTTNVVVTISPDGQLLVSTPELTFTDVNWKDPQTVTVTAVNDSDLEGLHTGTITHFVASSDPVYNNLSAPSVVAHITDNEGITVTPTTGLITTEAGGTAQFSVVLTNQPTADVIIGISSFDTTEGTVSTSSLTFTPDDWSVAKTVTVTGVNDWIIDGNISYTIITAPAVSLDARYNNSDPLDVSVTNLDNDVAGINITPTNGLTTSQSGGTAQFTATLNCQPDSDVTILFDSSDPTAGTLTALGDVIADYVNDYSPIQGRNGWYYGSYDSNHVFHELTWQQDMFGSGPDVYNWQNSGGVTLYPGGQGGSPWSVVRYVAQENGTYRYEGNIAKPAWAADPANPGNHGDGLIGHLYLNGTEIATYNIGGDDVVGLPISVNVGMKAGDVLDLYIDPKASYDGGWDSAYFPVSVQKLADRAIFTPENWNIPQAIIVSGVDSSSANDVPYQVTGAAASNDPHYNGISVPTVNLTNIAHEAPGVQIVESNGLTNVTEGGRTDTYTVRLTTQPTADVILTIDPGNQLTVSATTLTFTSSNWDDPKTITVTAVDDEVAEGPHTGTITHSVQSGDQNYNEIPVTSVTAYITDKVPAGVTIALAGPATTSEDGGTAHFTVVLNSQPASNVTVIFNSSDTTEGNATALGAVVADYVGEKSGTQGQNNWEYGYYPNGDTTNYQPMTWTDGWVWTPHGDYNSAEIWTWGPGGAPGNSDWAVIRYVAEESGTFQISGILRRYDWFGPGSNGDGVTGRLLLNGQQVWSGNIGTVYDPNGLPISAVVTMHAGDKLDLALDPNTNNGWDSTEIPSFYVQKLENKVTFTASNWMFPQTVTVKGVDDSAADGNVRYKITPTVGSSDPHYNGISASDVNLTNVDNDLPRLIMPPTQGAISSIVFSSTNGNAIKVQNVDTGSFPLHVQLTATNGKLTLGSTAGITFMLGNGTSNATMEFLGSAAAVNAALEGMKFDLTSTAGNLQVAVNNQGSMSSNGPLMAVGYVGTQFSTSHSSPAPGNVSPGGDNSPSTPTTPTLPSSKSTTPPLTLQSAYADLNSISSFEQSGKLAHAESINANKVVSANMPLDNVRLTQIAPVDVNADYLSTHDRFQAIAIQPIVPKLNNSDYSLQSVIDMQLLLKEMKAVVAQSETLPWLSKINVGTAIGISAGLGAGYIVMAFRWSALITSGLATTFPLWQWIDPLPILESSKNQSDNQKDFGENEQNLDSQGDESLESIVS